MNFPLYIAKRYILSNSKNNAINIINRIASLGIIVGAMALFVVLSVFSGLKVFSLSFTNDIDPDLKISSTLGKSFLVTPSQDKQINQIEDIVSYSKIIEERVLFTFDGKQEVTYLKGVDENFDKVNALMKDENYSYKYGLTISYAYFETKITGTFFYRNPENRIVTSIIEVSRVLL